MVHARTTEVLGVTPWLLRQCWFLSVAAVMAAGAGLLALQRALFDRTSAPSPNCDPEETDQRARRY